MESLTWFLILLIIPLPTMVNTDDYSINTFKDRMQEEGLFYIILLIKDAFSQDVDIISFEELKKK